MLYLAKGASLVTPKAMSMHVKEAEEVREASTTMFKSSVAQLEQQRGVLEKRIQALHLGIFTHSRKPLIAKVSALSFGLSLLIYPCMP